MFTGFILSLPVLGLNRLLFLTADSTGTALTSADFRKFLGWRGAAVLVLALLLYSLHLVIEVFAQIYLCDDILNGGRSTSLREIGRGFRALKRFANPVGFLMVLFMLIAAPLTGVGFIVTLTEKFYVPRFITSVIFETPLYMAVYGLIIAGMVFCTAQFAFSVHAVLIDQMKPGQALKTSAPAGIFYCPPGVISAFRGSVRRRAVYFYGYSGGLPGGNRRDSSGCVHAGSFSAFF